MKSRNFFLASILTIAGQAHADSSSIVSGFGTNIPLTFAVDQIVPEKYSISYGHGVDVNKKVNWKGGENWEIVLENTLSENGLFMETTPSNKLRITKNAKKRNTIFSGLKISNFRKNKDDVRDGSYPYDLSGRKGLVFVGDGEPEDLTPGFDLKDGLTELELSPKEVGDDAILVGVDHDELSKPKEVWPVFAGDTLENTLATWAEKSGWTVIWDSGYSYPIQASAEFSGDFIQVAGKIVQAMSNTKPPIQAKLFKGNKVIVLSNPSSSQ